MRRCPSDALLLLLWLVLMACSPGAGQFSPISTTLALYGGSLCGFCSSGFVMNMYRCAERRCLISD